jgi:hypothetical protein
MQLAIAGVEGRPYIKRKALVNKKTIDPERNTKKGEPHDDAETLPGIRTVQDASVLYLQVPGMPRGEGDLFR